MSRTFLFSPVGGTDPMSELNNQDGALIHILRVYDVDKVFLYLSKEMMEKQKKDQRYTYCIDKIAERKAKPIEYEFIERPELTRVHDFNYFYGDYRELLSSILAEIEEDDVLLLNISSGTPAMKSALLVLNHLWETRSRSIQVSTPAESMNEHIHDEDYDVETMWKRNPDNLEGFKNRCNEVQCVSLSNLKSEELIKKLVREYDYDAAFIVAQSLGSASDAYRDYLEFAKNRLMLNYSETNKFISKNNLKGSVYSPLHNSTDRKYFEYLLSLDIKIKKLQYADFMRAVTPIILDLMLMICKEQEKIDIVDKLCTTKKKGDYLDIRWSEEKFVMADEDDKKTKVIKVIKENIEGFIYDGFLYSSQLERILLELLQDENVKAVVKNLRMIDKERNTVAHQMVPVTEATIKTMTGLTPKQIMDELKKALRYSGIKIESKSYDSYDDMNREMIAMMK